MKIAYVIPSLAIWGGIERIVTDKANWLSAHGHEVLIVTTDQGTHVPPYQLGTQVTLADLGICFHHQYRYSGVRRLWDVLMRQCLFRQKLKELLNREHPDILVCTTAHYVGSIVRLKGSTPLVVESHSVCKRMVDTGRMLLFRRWLKRSQLQHADVLVALTEEDATQWRRYVHHVEVIPNFVCESDKQASAQLKQHRAIFVGRLDEQKQPDHVLKAWDLVHRQFPDWQLVIYGDGSLLEQTKKQAADLGDSVKVFAPTDKIDEAYRQSSLLVLSSSFEPFGLVMIEAMMCGVPVVAYDCDYGPRTVINDGQDGLLAAQDSIEALAERMAMLMGDETLRRKMGRQARISATRFTACNVMPMWEKLFLSLLPVP